MFEFFTFLLTVKTDHFSLKRSKNKRKKDFLAISPFTLIIKLLAEKSSDSQCFTFCQVFTFSISLRTGTENRPDGLISWISLVIKYANIWVGSLSRAHRKPHPDILQQNTSTEYSSSSTSSTISHFLKFPRLAVATMFFPHSAQCNYALKTTILGISPPLLPQFFYVSTVPRSPSGSPACTLLDSAQRYSFAQLWL